MGARKSTALLLILALVALAQPAHGQPSGSSALPIGLGFSSGTIEPVGSGVPVYTVGDQLWLESYNATVSVTVTPPGAQAPPLVTLTGIAANAPHSLLTFSSTDKAGLWSLTAFTSTKTTHVEFDLVTGGAPVQLSGYGVGNEGVLSMNYTLESSSAYDVSACAVGNQSTATAYLPIPGTSAGGTLLVSLNGSSISVLPQSSGGQFSFWATLSQNYAYEVNTEVVVQKEMQVAQTNPVQVSGGLSAAFSTALLDSIPLRTGVFSLGAHFESAQGVYSENTNVLVTGTGSWVWLQDCTTPQDPLSTTVVLNASLQEGPSVWPRYVYMLYDETGVGLFSVAAVPLQPATVQVMAEGWNHSLTDSQVEVSGVSQYSVGNGTVFLVGQQFPTRVTVATPQTGPQPVDVEKPYSASQVQVPADQLTVIVLSGGSPVSGISVTLTDAEGAVATGNVTDGQAVFYVPPGNYTANAVYQGNAGSSDVSMAGLAAGQSAQVTLQFGASDQTLDLILLALLGLGIVLSAFVWGFVYKVRRAASPLVGSKK